MIKCFLCETEGSAWVRAVAQRQGAHGRLHPICQGCADEVGAPAV